MPRRETVKWGFATLLRVTIAFSVSACTTGIDPNQLSENGDGGIDRTTYAGLRIYGEQQEGEAGELVHGPLDLVDVQLAMFTKCYDRHIGDMIDRSGAAYCEGRDIAALEYPDAGEECRGHVCMANLYRCLGYMNFELADGTGVFELATEQFKEKGFNIQDGVVEFMLDWNGSYYIREGGDAPVKYTYRIPPLSAKHRTLALLAAQAAFRKASVRAGQAVDAYRCMDTLSGESGTTRPTLVDHYVTGASESIQMLSESTKALVQNEQSLASAAKTETNDYVKAQKEQWNGTLNSHTSALRHVIGHAEGGMELVGVPTRLQRESQRKALAFLRETRPAGIHNLSVTDEQVVANGWKASHSEMTGLNASEVPEPDVDAVASRNGFTLSDLNVARRYLQDEQTALGRMPEEAYTDVYGHQRVYGAQKPGFQHPPAYHWKSSMGHASSDVCSAAGDPPTLDYAKKGTVQALDYLRDRLSTVLQDMGTKLGDDQQELVARAVIGTGQVIGEKRVQAEITDLGESVRVRVRVFGAKKGEEILLIEGERGYRCLLEGSIDGKPCDTSDLAILDHSNYVEWEATSPTAMDRYIIAEPRTCTKGSSLI